MPMSLSSDVLPQIKEFERSSTTVVNAYVKPLARRYLAPASAPGVREAGFAAPLQIMLSNGGIASAETAAEFPVRLIEFGPVAGADRGAPFRRAARSARVLSFDMGGTTAKACLIRDGLLPLTDELEVARSRRFTKSSGFPVATPAVNMIEIGAGGGSIAPIGALGIVQVGPESAGAAPGPACYGGGGTAPTVTDADLSSAISIPSASPAARCGSTRWRPAAVERTLGEPLGLDAVSAAWTAHDVVNETMAAAVRMHVTERGGDPSRPVLSRSAAPARCMSRISRPSSALAGAGAAARRRAVGSGLLLSPAAFDLKRTRKQPLARFDPDAVRREIADMKEAIAGRLAEAAPGAGRFCRDPRSWLYRAGISGAGTGQRPRRAREPRRRRAAGRFRRGVSRKIRLLLRRCPGRIGQHSWSRGMRATRPTYCTDAGDRRRRGAGRLSASMVAAPRRIVDFAVYDRDALSPGMASRARR